MLTDKFKYSKMHAQFTKWDIIAATYTNIIFKVGKINDALQMKIRWISTANRLKTANPVYSTKQTSIWSQLDHNTSTQLKNDEQIINLKLKLNSKTSDNNNNISSYREKKTRDKPLSKNESCFFCTLILVLKEDFHRTVKNAAHFLFIILCVFPCVALCVLIKKNSILRKRKSWERIKNDEKRKSIWNNKANR